MPVTSLTKSPNIPHLFLVPYSQLRLYLMRELNRIKKYIISHTTTAAAVDDGRRRRLFGKLTNVSDNN